MCASIVCGAGDGSHPWSVTVLRQNSKMKPIVFVYAACWCPFIIWWRASMVILALLRFFFHLGYTERKNFDRLFFIDSQLKSFLRQINICKFLCKFLSLIPLPNVCGKKVSFCLVRNHTELLVKFLL